jgi:uncharacterized protein
MSIARAEHRAPTPKAAIAIEYNVPVPMRDGTVLAADLFRPAGPGRYPVIVVRTPYDKTRSSLLPLVDTLGTVREGYVVVVQDVRGTSASQGRYRKYLHDADDGADSVAWAAAQEWSTGSVGMAGASYLGATQLHAARRRPPALKAIAPIFTPSAHYQGAEYEGGAFQLGRTLNGTANMAYASLLHREKQGEDVGVGRHVIESIVADPWAAFRRLPLVDLPRGTPWLSEYDAWLAHPDCGDFGRETAISEHFGLIDVPGLHVGGWYDIHLRGTLECYVGLRDGAASEKARANQRLIVTPWGHAIPDEVVGDIWLGPAASPMAAGFHALQLEFFDTFLKGEPVTERAPVRIFVMGANRWRDEGSWPLARARPARFYLRSGDLLSRQLPGDEAADQFVYDPRDPTPTVGGNTLLPGGGFFMGPRDRRRIQQRPDVLVYTTDVLGEDLEVTGPLTARLHVATSGRDTDFTVALVDVYPDGRAIGIADGILRLRYRNGFKAQQLAEPGRPYEIEVDLVATSNVFLAGHRIGLEISSSNFPRFDRNPNHGGVIATATEGDLMTPGNTSFTMPAEPRTSASRSSRRDHKPGATLGSPHLDCRASVINRLRVSHIALIRGDVVVPPSPPLRRAASVCRNMATGPR